MLINDGFCPRILRPAGGKGHPEVCGCWGGGKPVSAACLYSRHEPERTENVKEVAPCMKETAMDSASPNEMSERQPRRCSALTGSKNCSDEARMPSKTGSWELQLIKKL